MLKINEKKILNFIVASGNRALKQVFPDAKLKIELGSTLFTIEQKTLYCCHISYKDSLMTEATFIVDPNGLALNNSRVMSIHVFNKNLGEAVYKNMGATILSDVGLYMFGPLSDNRNRNDVEKSEIAFLYDSYSPNNLDGSSIMSIMNNVISKMRDDIVSNCYAIESEQHFNIDEINATFKDGSIVLPTNATTV